MAKHDRAMKEKELRNQIYAMRYKQRVCKECKHKSSRQGRCVLCGGEMKEK